MRVAWHIFRKDARRLWWEIAVTMGALAMLARMDIWRDDRLPGPLEGMLNLLLPVAWCYLIALAVQQEPLVGDRQFWITRPVPRPALLASKMLFAAAFVMGPMWIADSVILSVSGFPPSAHLGPLIWKQAAVFVAVVLPAAALAAVTRNTAQFFAAAVPVTLAAVFLMSMVERLAFFRPPDVMRRGVALLILAAAALAILALQYAWRRTGVARASGLTAVTAAALLYFYLPVDATHALRAAWSGSPVSEVRIERTTGDPPEIRWGARDIVVAAVPIALAGIAGDMQTILDPVETEVVGPDGSRWRTAASPGQGHATGAVEGNFVRMRDKEWIAVRMARPVYRQLAGQRATFRGKMAITFHRRGQPVTLPLEGESTAVSGLGRCWSSIQAGRNNDVLKVTCESPEPLPFAPVRLVDGDREWNQRLGDTANPVSYPASTPLSPLYRQQAFFHVTEAVVTGEGSKWLVPREALSRARIEITPLHPAGSKVVNYELRDIDPSAFVVRDR